MNIYEIKIHIPAHLVLDIHNDSPLSMTVFRHWKLAVLDSITYGWLGCGRICLWWSLWAFLYRSNFVFHTKYLIFNNARNVFDEREVWPLGMLSQYLEIFVTEVSSPLNGLLSEPHCVIRKCMSLNIIFLFQASTHQESLCACLFSFNEVQLLRSIKRDDNPDKKTFTPFEP